MRKKTWIIGIGIVCAVSISAQQNKFYLSYIEQYASLAIEQQVKYGVPAAITMAQGLLESRAGQSELAVKANNHFGVKCASDWSGRTYTHTDDKADECFRCYKNAKDSYEDHSLFLQRKRYASLFQLPITDYKAWAHGLKACGYATDPNYAAKLIRLIEDYGLQHLVSDTDRGFGGIVETPEKSGSDHTKASAESDNVPTNRKKNKVRMLENHVTDKCNGVRYILVQQGDTYASLAVLFNMNEKTLRRYNDAIGNGEVQAGERVYLYAKKNKANKKTPSCTCGAGESVRTIAQRYGVKVSAIRKMNKLSEDSPLKKNQTLRLR